MDVQAIIDDIDRQFVQMRRVRELFVSIMEGDQPASMMPRTAKRIGRQDDGCGHGDSEESGQACQANDERRGQGPDRRRAEEAAQEPATRKYAAKPKATKKMTAKAKKATATEDQPASEAAA